MSYIDNYLADLSPADHGALQHLREVIQASAPELEEVKSYGMPGFKYRGKYLGGFCAFKDHLSFFPTAHPVAELESELTEFTHAKGTIQFTADRPLPDELVGRLIAIRRADIDAG